MKNLNLIKSLAIIVLFGVGLSVLLFIMKENKTTIVIPQSLKSLDQEWYYTLPNCYYSLINLYSKSEKTGEVNICIDKSDLSIKGINASYIGETVDYSYYYYFDSSNNFILKENLQEWDNTTEPGGVKTPTKNEDNKYYFLNSKMISWTNPTEIRQKSEKFIQKEKEILAQLKEFTNDAERSKAVFNFILNSSDYIKHGDKLSYINEHDANTYCEGCKLVQVQYDDKLNEKIYYDLDVLVKKDGGVSLLDKRKWDSNKGGLINPNEVKKGQSLFGITLNNKGYVLYDNKVISDGFVGFDSNSGKDIKKVYSKLLVFNFEKYKKVYFIGCDEWAEDCYDYVFDKTNQKLIQEDGTGIKYFYPTSLGYSTDDRYLAMWDFPDDGFVLTIFDIEQNKFIGYKWYETIDIKDFKFTDGKNFIIKYRNPEEYANQLKTVNGNVDNYFK